MDIVRSLMLAIEMRVGNVETCFGVLVLKALSIGPYWQWLVSLYLVPHCQDNI